MSDLEQSPSLCTRFGREFSHSSSSRMANRQDLLSWAPARCCTNQHQTQRRWTHSIDLL